MLIYEVRSTFTSYFYFTFTFNNYCPNGIFPMGNLGCLPKGKPAATGSRHPTNVITAKFSFSLSLEVYTAI